MSSITNQIPTGAIPRDEDTRPKCHVGTVHVDNGRYGTLRIFRDDEGGLYAYDESGADVLSELWDEAPRVWGDIVTDYCTDEAN